MTNCKLKCFFQKAAQPNCVSSALLLLRLVVGLAFIQHGWGKIQTPFNWMPPGAPIPGFFQFLAAISEFGGGVAYVIGLLTPLATLGILSTMTVALFVHISSGDPFVSHGPGHSFELALVYFCVAVLFLIVGPGKFSLDTKVFGNKQ